MTTVISRLLRQHAGPAAGQRCLSSSQAHRLPVLLSSQFIPTLRSDAIAEEGLESVKLLLRGGYIRQSSSGFYSLLPIGLKMVRKIESLIDEEMEKIGASRVELPSLLSSSLWHKSGRFTTMGSELYKVKDRKGSNYILAPTFEEEITKLVGDEVQSWRDLPVKVYQTSRKYRDEPRPRNGLLRTREFLMKDLYTFDADLQGATQSYNQVQAAYSAIMTRIFGEGGKDWRVAEADTGAMGGAQSHEYQVQDNAGEDELFLCSDCSYTANSEMATSLPLSQASMPVSSEDVQVWLYGSNDVLAHGCTMTAVVTASKRQINGTKLARLLPGHPHDSLLSSNAGWDWKDRPEGPMVRFDRLSILVDSECQAVEVDEISQAILDAVEVFGSPVGADPVSAQSAKLACAPRLQDYFQETASSSLQPAAITSSVVDVRQAEAEDKCPSCKTGSLQHTKSIEVGHTFLLGSRYSTSLGYEYAHQDGKGRQALQMGCYGIGITRILGVLAQIASRQFQATTTSAKRTGFAWHPTVAPFTALVLPLSSDETKLEAANTICQALQRDSTRSDSLQWSAMQSQNIAIDDRANRSPGSRLSDADLLGCPLVFVLGKHFDETGQVEVRCGRFDPTFVPLSHFVVPPGPT